MNKNDRRYPLTYVILITVLSIMISWWWMPSTYYYNSDVYISPAGMLMSEGYRTIPFTVSHGVPGFYAQGIYAVYNSWPPLNFLALAGWQEIFGSDLHSSRWLYVLVKGMTHLLCFLILFKLTRNKIISLLSTIVFILFPYRILYSLLLFSDSWILLFGMLITLLLIRAIQQEKLFKTRTIFVIGLVTGIGALFSWQVFFYLPAILIYGTFTRHSSLVTRQFTRHSSFVIRNLFWCFIGLLPCILLLSAWFYWIIIHPVSDVTAANLGTVKPATVFETNQSAFHQLLNRSWWGFFKDPAHQSVLLLKRILKTLVEYFPVIALVLFNRYFNKNKRDELLSEPMRSIINIHGISVILYLAILPLMFAPHEHQIPLFALLATLVLARELSKLRSPVIPGFMIIAFQVLVFFFVIPRVHKVDHALKRLDAQIVTIMKPGAEIPKALFLLHSGHPDHIGLLAETHVHIYNGVNLHKFRWDETGMDSSFRAQLAIFPEGLRKITDSTNLWILTTDSQLCSRKFSGFNIEINRLNDSVCLLHLQRKLTNR